MAGEHYFCAVAVAESFDNDTVCSNPGNVWAIYTHVPGFVQSATWFAETVTSSVTSVTLAVMTVATSDIDSTTMAPNVDTK